MDGGAGHVGALVAVARYRDVDAEAFAWLVDPRPAARRFVADVIDAIRVLRAADALRQRGTTQRTSAGYEVCVDRRSGRAVMAVRSADGRFGAWMWLDNRHSIAEGNLRVVDLTHEGSLRIAFHRGDFGGDGATERVVDGHRRRRSPTSRPTCSAASPDAGRAAIGSPRRDRAAARRPELRQARRRGSRTRPPAARRHGRCSSTSRIPHRRSKSPSGTGGPPPLTVDHAEVDGWFEQLALHGLTSTAIDRQAALRDVLRVRLRPGEVVLSPGTAASVVRDPARAGHPRRADRRLPTRAAPPVAPVGVTGVVRGAERNAAVIADADVDVLAIPAERYPGRLVQARTRPTSSAAWRRWLADGSN